MARDEATAAATDVSSMASLRRRGEECMAAARHLLLSADWRVESKRSGDTVHSCSVPGLGRVFMLTAFFNCSAKTLKEILVDRNAEYPKWSELYTSQKKIMDVDSCTDVTYSLTTARLGGLVAPRDWLSLRHWAFAEGAYFSSGVAVEHPDVPATQPGYVRAQCGLSLYAMDDAPAAAAAAGEAGAQPRSRLRFVSCGRLGGWLPQSVVDRAFSMGVLDFARDLRRHVDQQSTAAPK